ncbi:hypothetical protein ACIQNI_30510 [Streptomyces sp. NPDC091266]|uniref:hypothetical protein n=1 Tax=Streptomyces sp. NPDC091266 TaxID=3365978 RepID=UPI00382C8681
MRWPIDQEGLHVSGSDWIAGGDFLVAGDRIEAATMGHRRDRATGGSIHLDNITAADFPDGLAGLLDQTGVDGGVCAQAHGPLQAVEAATGPHPGLPTDSAPQLAALLTQADGPSVIAERVYPRRDTHVQGLRAFGANVTTTGSVIDVRGPGRLHGAAVEARDIRFIWTMRSPLAVGEQLPYAVRVASRSRSGHSRSFSTMRCSARSCSACWSTTVSPSSVR